MAGTLALIPRYLTEAEKEVGISELQGEEFRRMTEIFDIVFAQAENGKPNNLQIMTAAIRLALIVAGDSRLARSIEPGDYSAVYLDGVPLWLVVGIQEALSSYEKGFTIKGVFNKELVDIWPFVK